MLNWLQQQTGNGAVTAYPPPDTNGRIIPFRRRGAVVFHHPPAPPPDPAKGLGEYERTNSDGPDEFRHRMKMNGLAALVAIVLIALGLWIVDAMVAIRDGQNCALTGRKNCDAIAITSSF